MYVFGPLGLQDYGCAAKFDPFLSLDYIPALHPGAIQGKEGIKFCYLATLRDKQWISQNLHVNLIEEDLATEREFKHKIRVDFITAGTVSGEACCLWGLRPSVFRKCESRRSSAWFGLLKMYHGDFISNFLLTNPISRALQERFVSHGTFSSTSSTLRAVVACLAPTLKQ